MCLATRHTFCNAMLSCPMGMDSQPYDRGRHGPHEQLNVRSFSIPSSTLYQSAQTDLHTPHFV